ncbi:MAG: helix-turn-helix domain-containing protein [Bacteroidales bacterium]|nr:helix-turn-helix domain-containing protein [Bacteroidales bacterium]
MEELIQGYISSYKVKLYIKNMVCIRCKIVVKNELEKLGIGYILIELGQVEIESQLSPEQRLQLDEALRKSGLELMDDKKSVLIEKIKCIIIETVHYSEVKLKTNLSDYISDKLGYDYTYLANLFSEVTGITIEKFYLNHKIEKVKELLVYNELNLTEIAFDLGYSSVAHLSNQFKKFTGLSPSHFKRLKNERRIMLENL